MSATYLMSESLFTWCFTLENLSEGWFYCFYQYVLCRYAKSTVLADLAFVLNILHTHYTHTCVIHCVCTRECFWCKTSLIWVKITFYCWVFSTSYFHITNSKFLQIHMTIIGPSVNVKQPNACTKPSVVTTQYVMSPCITINTWRSNYWTLRSTIQKCTVEESKENPLLRNYILYLSLLSVTVCICFILVLCGLIKLRWSRLEWNAFSFCQVFLHIIFLN